ncbi:MAG: SBBP repeat-containing protein [Bryobacteraceae bacterium]
MYRLGQYLIIAGIIVAQLPGAVLHKDFMATQPLRFEENQGQISSAARFIARGPNYLLEIQAGENRLTWTETSSERTATVRTRLVGANRNARLEGREPLDSHTSYFLGASRTEWHPMVPNYGRIQTSGVYPGVDLVFYGASGKLEYDFVIQPGANPRSIRLDLDGIPEVSIAADGDLVLRSAAGDVHWNKPFIYQTVGESRKVIPGGFKRIGKHLIGFQIGQYDASRALIIDPVVMNYATYFGGSGNEAPRAIGTDAAGNVYVAGETSTQALQTTKGVVQPTYGGETMSPNMGDAFVAKFTPTGSLAYVTYLGGSGDDLAGSIAVDPAGNAYVTGYTNSSNFPTTPGVFQPSFAGLGGNSCNRLGDAFVVKLNPSGTQLIYSTYLGGSLDDAGAAIAIDAAGNAYVAGTTLSTNFPVTPGVIQAKFAGGGGEPPRPDCLSQPAIDTGDGFVAKLNPTGSQLLFATYLGGEYDDAALAIAIDSSSNVYVAGATISVNFPVTPGVFQNAFHGSDGQNEYFHYGDGFITKLNSTATALLYSTYLGGLGDDIIYSVVVDSQGDAYVAGSTSSQDFPVTSHAVQPVFGGYDFLPFLIDQNIGDGFVAQLSPDGTALLYSTYLGGANNDQAFAVAVDSAGLMYVTGSTDSQNFPVTTTAFQYAWRGDGGQDPYLPNGDGFFTIINPNSTTLVYSTYFGGTMDDVFAGLTFDPSGNIWLVGNTMSTNLPVTLKTAAQPVYGGYRPANGVQGDAMLVEFTGLPAATEPAISTNGVVNGASFQPGIVPNSWATILGRNLASQPANWDNAIINGQLPTLLGGVRVTIGGQNAYLNYVSPTQINLIVPNVGAGTFPVVVTNSAGTIAPVDVVSNVAGPAFFPWPDNQVVATRQDFTYAAKNGTLGATTVPAAPGEVIILWATGFGPTTPAAPVGVVTPSNQTYSTSTLPTVSIDNIPATVYGAALAPGFAGLYQVAIQVPTSLGDGDWPIQATIAGVQSPSGTILTVQQ